MAKSLSEGKCKCIFQTTRTGKGIRVLQLENKAREETTIWTGFFPQSVLGVILFSGDFARQMTCGIASFHYLSFCHWL